MFVKQATTDRLLGVLVTLATAGALFFIQHRLKFLMGGGGRRRGGSGDRRRRGGKDAKKATDYGDPYFRARWGKRGSGLELVQHRGQCMCGRFCFRLLAPADVKALDCPGRIRYPHIFVPAGAFTPLSDLRLLTLYSARSPVLAHVVVHAFCSACGVPVFRASDGTIDTLVVNIECLASDGIRSLEVAYYEDLLGFPPEDAAAQHGHGQGQGPPAYPAKPAAPFSASKGPRRTSPFRPAPPATVPAEENAGAIVPLKGSRPRSAPAAASGSGSGGWAGGLPIRLFGARSVINGVGGGSSGPRGLVRASGTTSLLAHLLSRASLATGGAITRPGRALRQRDVDEADEEEDEEELEMAAAAAAAAAAAQQQHQQRQDGAASSDMWQAWDESCDAVQHRGRPSRWGGEGNGVGGSSGSRRPGSALGGASTTTVGTAGAASSLGGALTSARAAAGGGSFTNTSNFYRAAAQGNGWERLEGCTPPSMHQLRYHLKRHIKRRMNWLHDPDFAALCLDSDEEGEGEEQEQEQYRPQSRQQQHQQLQQHYQQQQRRLAEEEAEYLAGCSMSASASAAPSPAPSEGPHPSTPLGDRTTSYTNHGSGASSSGVAAAAGLSTAKAAERRRGEAAGGSTSRGGGRENEGPAVHIAPPPAGLSETGKKED